MGNYIPDKMIVWCGNDQDSGHYEIDTAKFLDYVNSHPYYEHSIEGIEEFIHENHLKKKISIYDESEVDVLRRRHEALGRIKDLISVMRVFVDYTAKPEQWRQLLLDMVKATEGL